MLHALILILACRISSGGMFVCKLPTPQRTLQVIVDSGSNVSIFPAAKHKIRVLDSKGKTFLQLKPTDPAHPVVEDYNRQVGAHDRVDGIIGEDVLHKFRRVTFNFQRKTVEFER
jgi:hypothetical protein